MIASKSGPRPNIRCSQRIRRGKPGRFTFEPSTDCASFPFVQHAKKYLLGVTRQKAERSSAEINLTGRTIKPFAKPREKISGIELPCLLARCRSMHRVRSPPRHREDEAPREQRVRLRLFHPASPRFRRARRSCAVSARNRTINLPPLLPERRHGRGAG